MTKRPALDAKAFVAAKLALADRIRHDGQLSGSIRLIGAELCSLANERTGYSWASEKYLAEKLSVTDRTIKRAVSALKAAGYIEVEKVGRNNRYRPVFAALEKGTICPPSETGQGTNCPLFGNDRGQNAQQQGTISPANRGQKSPPISLENSLGISARADARAGGGEGAAGPVDYNLGLPGVALRRRLGDDVFKSWLGKVGFVAVEDSELVLQAPSRFVASHLRNNFEPQILEAWRVQHPQISQVSIVIGATPISSAKKPQVDAGDARWLVEHGIAIVSARLRCTRDNADRTIVRWLDRCGKDVRGLRRIIVEADAQGLVEEQFTNLVTTSTKALLFADQKPLPLGPVSVKRRA
jgi:DNA-binding transcriptional ArsR family regulator